MAREVGVGMGALQRWQADAQSEADKSAWCREHGLCPGELDQWRASCTSALAEPEEARATPQATRATSLRIGEFERDLQRWKARCARTLECEMTGDGRPQAVHPRPRHALSQAEREGLLRMARVAVAGDHARPGRCARPPRTSLRPCARWGAGA